MERFVERVLMASRWLMAPLYLGLALLLLLFVAQFFLELAQLVAAMATGGGAHLALSALHLLDLVLVASLIVMVMLSGFEHFVARITLGAAQQRLAWLTELDTGSIDIRIMGSITVISAIYLLEQLFEIDQITTGKLLWLVILQLTFVASAVLLALLERLTRR